MINKNLTLFFLVCTCMPGPCSHQEKCSSYEIKDNESHCRDLKAYIACMELFSGKCRGDIGYHSFVTVSKNEFKKRCADDENLLRNNISERSQSLIPSNNRNICPSLFDDKKEHKFCGFFGDPHLRTFDGRYQTCRIHGAWPVIENPFFGIMVTNDAVLNSTTATAPTKVFN